MTTNDPRMPRCPDCGSEQIWLIEAPNEDFTLDLIVDWVCEDCDDSEEIE